MAEIDEADAELVEVVAEAIWLDRYTDSIWSEIFEESPQDYRGHARAAIEAIRAFHERKRMEGGHA